jgi:hypothetical protein
MLVERMISTHKDVRGNTSSKLIHCIEECFACAQTCISCADACMAEDKGPETVHSAQSRLC